MDAGENSKFQAQLKLSSKTHRLRKAVIWFGFALAIMFAAFNWLMPWLGRRGNLNGIIEKALKSSLAVPVTIEKIDTEPLSQLSVTHVRSVSAKAQDRFSFTAKMVSIQYDPLELLTGRIRNATLEDLEVFINLDAELSGIATLPDPRPELKKSSDSQSSGDEDGDESILPFTIDTTTLERGKVTLRLNARELELSNLRVELSHLGKSLGQTFFLSLGALGGTVRCWGGVDVVRASGSPTRYRFHESRVIIDGIEVSRLVQWLEPSEDVSSSWLDSILARARGKLKLEGSLDGTWPESVQLSLSTHASDVFAAHGNDLVVNEGSVELHLQAEALGELETLKFSVSTHGSGRLQGQESTEENGEVDIEGELHRFEGPGGVLEIAPSTVLVENAGEVRFSGRIEQVLGDAPQLDLSIETPSIDAYAIMARLPPAFKTALPGEIAKGKAGGELSANLHVTGSLARPRADGTFEALNLTVPVHAGAAVQGEVRGEWKGLELDSRSGTWSVDDLRAESSALDVKSLAQVFNIKPEDYALGGSLRARVETSEQCVPVASNGLRGKCELSLKSGNWALPSGTAGATDLNGELIVDASFFPQARKLILALDLNTTAAELLAGSIYARPGARPMSLRAEAQVSWGRDWTLEGVNVAKLDAETAFTGPLKASGKLFRASHGGFDVDGSLDAHEIPAEEAFPVFVSEPMAQAAPFLAGGKLVGRAAMVLRIEGNVSNPLFWGRLTLQPSLLSFEGVAVEGLEVDIPFELGTPETGYRQAEDTGFLSAAGINAGGLRVEGVRLPFHLAQGSYSLEPAAVNVYGGRLEVKEAVVTPQAKGGLQALLRLKGRKLRVERIASAHELPVFPGELEIDLDPLVLAGSRMESSGTLKVKAFGGEIALRDLTIDNVQKPYSDLRLKEGKVERLRLDQVGKAFHFGIMSGVLEGSLTDLGFTGGEATSFKLDVASVPVRGVPQFLNRAAIESIRRVFAGPLGALEETFFSKFRYADFGFVCSLDDGIFRLRGKYPEGDKEYIMRGRWYQVPRINIINGRPDHPYDWKTIVTNLRRIYESERP